MSTQSIFLHAGTVPQTFFFFIFLFFRVGTDFIFKHDRAIKTCLGTEFSSQFTNLLHLIWTLMKRDQDTLTTMVLSVFILSLGIESLAQKRYLNLVEELGGWMGWEVGGWMDGWIDGVSVCVRMDRWVDEWTDGWANGHPGWMVGWVMGG
jgi:hypothetical protein